MSRKFRISYQAESDLDHIAETIADSNPTAAISVIDRLEEAFLLLANHPEIGTVREDLAQGIRMYSPRKPAENYIIFYYPIVNGVEISDIIHGARDWLDLLKAGRQNKE